jgi:predicted nucleic acid-binding protein
MSFMTGPCFVDANVFVYARDGRVPDKQRCAEQWLDVLWRDRLGRTSTQAISEFYSVATRKLGIAPERAWQTAERYFLWNPRALDEALLRRGREIQARYRLSWWDGLIVAAAQLENCILLLTEDLQDGAAFGPVTVRSPFTLEVREAAAAYAVERRTRSLHRPRGRPRRAAVVA